MLWRLRNYLYYYYYYYYYYPTPCTDRNQCITIKPNSLKPKPYLLLLNGIPNKTRELSTQFDSCITSLAEVEVDNVDKY